MTRNDFYNERLARYLSEGMAMQAARARASAVTCSHWPLTPYTQTDADWDTHSPEANRWHE
jgi:hypothetical protein